MGAEKKLQKLLDKANKGTGNTTEATDGRGEISDALVDSGKARLVKKGKRLYDRMNKGSGIKMVSPLNFPGANSSNSSCWDGYRKDGVKDSPSGTGETVNNCVKIGSPAKQDYNEVNVQDLQDMGKVKKNKKGKYVVNENPKTAKDTLYIPKKFKSYTGKKPKVGKMIDESDYEDLSRKANKNK